MTSKLEPAARKEQILTEALRQAAKCGYQNIKRADIARALGISTGLINKYFDSMHKLKCAVMREAIRVECLPVIAQGIALRDRRAMAVSDELQARALASLAS